MSVFFQVRQEQSQEAERGQEKSVAFIAHERVSLFLFSLPVSDADQKGVFCPAFSMEQI